MAICGGSLQEVKVIINTMNGNGGGDNQVQSLNQPDSDGFRPLHSAVSLNQLNMAVDMTQLLLSCETDVLATDAFGNTALHWAARAGNHKISQILALKNCPIGKNNAFYFV